jgi:hypothetical protein
MNRASYERVQGPCPFCHADPRYRGTIDCDFSGKATPAGQPALYHSVPTCPDYDRMTGDEFVRAVIDRQHLQ